MPKARLPINEEARLKDLYSYNILDTKPEAAFDELLELAAEICDTPISLITLIDKDRQWFKARKGLELSETPREVSFCAHTILNDQVLTVEDTLNDCRFNRNPYVTDHLKVRFYAGAPIVSLDGNNLGTICLIDTKPRKFTAKQEHLLSLLANQASRLLELHRRSNEVVRKSGEIISRKSKSFRKVITEHEKTNSLVSYNLHEEVAQTVAACKLYLHMAQNNPGDAGDYINTVIDRLDEVINELRSISYRILPPHVGITNIGTLTRNLVNRVNELSAGNITLETHNAVEVINSDTTVLMLRILYDWLHIIQNLGLTYSAHVILSLQENLLLVITDDNSALRMEARERELSQSAILDKVQAFNGSVDLFRNTENYVLKIMLPFTFVSMEPEFAETGKVY